MNKKGSEEMSMATLIEVILILVITALMTLVISREISSDKFEKLYLSQDMAMFIDTIYASPNNLVVSYPQRTEEFSFDFDHSEVTVFKESEGTALGQKFSFTEESATIFEYKTLHPYASESVQVIFTKTFEKIIPFSGLFVRDIE